MSEFDNLEHFPIGIFTLNKLAMGFPIPKSSISTDNRGQSQSKFRVDRWFPAAQLTNFDDIYFPNQFPNWTITDIF